MIYEITATYQAKYWPRLPCKIAIEHRQVSRISCNLYNKSTRLQEPSEGSCLAKRCVISVAKTLEPAR